MQRPLARAAVLAALCLAVIAPASVSATHQEVRVSIQVQHYNDVSVAEYTTDAACNGTYCFVQLPLSGRDAGRVLRWCGDTTLNLTVLAGSTGVMQECNGSSTWKVRITAGLRLDDNNVASHPDDVSVEVQVVKG